MLARQSGVPVRFLLGAAGSGKTFRCLKEIGALLRAEPEGAPLLLIAPKQTTYQLERQLLADPEMPGYTRLHILSFDRLAHFIFRQLRQTPPRMLDEEGRLMVLRALLAKRRKSLKLFRASARLTGFARQLSIVLGDFQRHGLTPDSLKALAATVKGGEGLVSKLEDLALMLGDYLGWLATHKLEDNERLLSAAAEALPEDSAPAKPLRLGQIWVDGFAEFSPQEIDLLAALFRHAETSTITFCLDQVPAEKASWLSTWSVVQNTFAECRRRIEAVPGASVAVELLKRNPAHSRFANNPVLQYLEHSWADGEPCPAGIEFPSQSLRVATCVDPDAEGILAAREILAHVRAGGRYRDVTVLVRTLEDYHQSLERVFSRYEIPFFLDRRESVSHHPLAELTRSALRTMVFQWKHEDWFAALKTGLVSGDEKGIDELENEALARGWKGGVWHQPLRIPDQAHSEKEEKRLRALEGAVEKLRKEIVPPFERFELALTANRGRLTGPQLATGLRAFWDSLDVRAHLEKWAAAAPGQRSSIAGSVHATVWEQMNSWLRNVELAFSDETLSLREWLPVLEAGLSNLSVGVIPPALDQVLVGAVDRSRNPEVKLAIVLGLNETVFPASPQPPALLTEADHGELEKRGVVLGATTRLQLSRERYHAYIACTRASERLVLTSALNAADAGGSPLNPSPFLSHVQRLFPKLEIETVRPSLDWRESLHASEVMVPLLKLLRSLPKPGWPTELRPLSRMAALANRWESLVAAPAEEALVPALAERLYGTVLRTSVSRMEQFGACPFRFFVHSGLRAEERKRFELDVREQGSFQHDVLAEFHDELRREKKLWRDISPLEARRRIGLIAEAFMASYRDGLLKASEQSRFLARVLSNSLQDFIEAIVGWMHTQYLPNPMAVEIPFGSAGAAPAWELELDQAHRLALRGRIDRIDVYCPPDGETGHCVVVDYKSSGKKLDPLMIAHGLQLQLLAYLNVLCQWPEPHLAFGARRLIPAGVFYVNLRGGFQSASNRREAQAAEQASENAYQHAGRFDAEALHFLDARKKVKQGDQFNYRRRNDGGLYRNSQEAMNAEEFAKLLNGVAATLQDMGRRIFAGEIKLDPYRKGTTVACDQCDYRAICRIDPWTHKFRSLRLAEEIEITESLE